ncbi:MAG: hypothetical protein WC657_06220 [Candidatus Paceibacterota bacterium]|jgi:hypothetical protein
MKKVQANSNLRLTVLENDAAAGDPLAAIREEYRQSLDVLSEQGFCTYGQYPWDDWQRRRGECRSRWQRWAGR